MSHLNLHLLSIAGQLLDVACIQLHAYSPVLHALQGWFHSSGCCAGIAGGGLYHLDPSRLHTQPGRQWLHGDVATQSHLASGLPDLHCYGSE